MYDQTMSLTHISERILEVPALERDFHNGALFDARNEKIVVGTNTLNLLLLKKYLSVLPLHQATLYGTQTI